MNAIVTRKTGQTYEVDDFQHNFEVSRNRSETDIVTTKCWYLSVEMWIFGSREDEKSWSMVMW